MISLFKVFMSPKAGATVNEVLHSGMITQGPVVEQYEAALRTWFGFDQLFTVNSGTSALQLALDLAGVNAGDTVISSAMTCSATNTAILSRQAEIIWADIDSTTGNVTPDSVLRALGHAAGRKVKAIMMVHWGGEPCDVVGINAIAAKYRLKTIEDAAHAIGAEVKGTKIGQFSDFTCFSTQAIKHLTTVDGGILACRSAEDHRVGKLLRWFGLNREGPRTDFRCELDLVRAGYKYHMNDVNAAVGLANLPHLDWILEQHRSNAAYYNVQFAGIPGLYPIPMLSFVGHRSASWVYTMVIGGKGKRDALIQFLAERGVQTSKVHSPNHTHTFTKNFGPKYLPNVEFFDAHQLSIPVGWWVRESDRAAIATSILEFAEREL